MGTEDIFSDESDAAVAALAKPHRDNLAAPNARGTARRDQHKAQPVSTRKRGRKWTELSALVLERDARVCQLRIASVCIGEATTVDHYIPIKAWPEGEYVESNLVAACSPCNTRKAAKLTGWQERPAELDPYSL